MIDTLRVFAESLFFARPWALLLLGVPVIIAFWEWTHAGHPLQMPFDHSDAPAGHGLARLVRAANGLPAALLAVAILFLAGPRVHRPPTQQPELSNILFVLDVSGSMTANFGGDTRHAVAMEAIQDFVDQRPGDAFGLTIFSDEVVHWVPPTRDRDAVRLATEFTNPRNRIPGLSGGTQIGKALLAAAEEMARLEAGDRLLILVSDGNSSDLREMQEQVLSRFIDLDITMHDIHIGGTTPEPAIHVISQYTGGQVFQPGDRGALQAVFREIDEMQRTRMRPVAAAPIDCFEPFAWAGLGLLAVHLLALALGVRFTPW